MRLELRQEPSGLRHYLDGRAVHAGDVLEIREGAAWLLARYEWSFRAGDPPRLCLDAGELRPYEGTALRWPVERGAADAGRPDAARALALEGLLYRVIGQLGPGGAEPFAPQLEADIRAALDNREGRAVGAAVDKATTEIAAGPSTRCTCGHIRAEHVTTPDRRGACAICACARFVAARTPAEDCPHLGVTGPCMPRVGDGRCIWCERELPPRRWPRFFDFARWSDRTAQVREAFDAFDAFEVLPGELALDAGDIGDLRPAVAFAAAIGEHLHDVTREAGAPWLGRLDPGGHLAVYRDQHRRLWCLIYLDGECAVYLEPVTPGSAIATELGIEPDPHAEVTP